MDENKKRTPYEEWLDEIAANSPFGENSVFSHTSRERQKVEAEKREREWREKSQMLTVGAQAAKEIPEKFS